MIFFSRALVGFLVGIAVLNGSGCTLFLDADEYKFGKVDAGGGTDSEEDSSPDGDVDSDTDADVDSDTDSDTDTDADTDTDTDTDSDTDTDTDTDADSGTGDENTDDGSDSVSETESGDTDTGEPPLEPVAMCVRECGTAADCPEVGADKLHREANFSCENGLCKYTGCVSDANCADEYPAEGYICSDSGECMTPCESAQDCALPGDSENEDNWVCEDGGCRYLGCLNSFECVMDYGTRFVCTDVLHIGTRGCTQSCESSADCVWTIDEAQLAWDEDNYNCEKRTEGELYPSCDYRGCVDNDECGDGYRCVLPDSDSGK